MVKAYQLYYNSDTRARIDPLATPVDTSGVVTPYFESHWIATLPIPAEGMMGVFSPQFRRKTRMPLTRFIIRAKNRKCDIAYPFMGVFQANTWMQGAGAHPQFWKKASLILAEVNLEHIMRMETADIYCNYFLMRVDLWHEFRSEWLLPVMQAMDKHSNVIDQPCSYRSSSGHSLLDIKRATGFNFYTYRPFICERLISSFAQVKKLNQFICH